MVAKPSNQRVSICGRTKSKYEYLTCSAFHVVHGHLFVRNHFRRQVQGVARLSITVCARDAVDVRVNDCRVEARGSSDGQP